MSKQSKPGFLLVLEGVDGSGKSTLAAGLKARLEAAGVDTLSSFEPTRGPIGQKIRAIALKDRASMSPQEEFSLFHEDRKIHVAEVVRPALAAGKLVLQDRSYFSTVAYQAERGLDPAWLLEQSEAIAPRPDLALLIDLDPEEALARIRAGRAGGTDDFERLDVQRRIRARFLQLPLTRIDASGASPAALLDRCWTQLKDSLREHPLGPLP